RIPAAVEGIDAGEEVWLEPLRPLAEIERGLLCIGSHDMLLDLLADFMRRAPGGFSLSSAHVGSLGGLSALKRGECHLAGTHLIDEDTGEYNLSWIARLFAPGEVALIHLARRQPGRIVPEANPTEVRGLEDVPSRGVHV